MSGTEVPYSLFGASVGSSSDGDRAGAVTTLKLACGLAIRNGFKWA